MKPWDGIISEEEQKACHAAGFGPPSEIGKRPAIRPLETAPMRAKP